MGIDIYTYARQGDSLIGCHKLTVDWGKILGHPLDPMKPGEALQSWDIGYIGESYHGHVHPVRVFIPESFDRENYEQFGEPDEYGDRTSGCHIPLATLKARLPATLEVAKKRWAQYGEPPEGVEKWWGYQQYIDFVKVHEAIAGGYMQAYIMNSY